MKSPHIDSLNKTSCKNCVFAIYTDKTQTGCVADRLSKLDYFEAYDNDKEFNVITSLCNLYRTNRWNNGVPSLEIAYGEIAATFDILINCNNIDETSLITLTKFIDELSYKYPNLYKRNNIVLYHRVFLGNKDLISQLMRRNNNILVSICGDEKQFVHEYAIKSKKLFHTLISVDNIKQDTSMLNKINNSLNYECKKFIVAEYNGLFISNVAYRINYYNNLCTNYDTNIENLINKAKSLNLYLEAQI